MPRILIIDDDDQVRSTLRGVLERDGYTVSEASGGASGIGSCHKNPPDLVITDIFMPDKDGLETICEIRMDHPDMRIIAISGGGVRTGHDYLLAAKTFGADDILYKPFRSCEITAAARKLLKI